ncbi:hypothetical protein O9G_005622 [Rozella allomycis CSF55]|uniref:Uncharacterized protein n=1 Tax=Rozella allomycis (strain CSF55) TaxID=988480 RepID=A0A075AUM7_ROZAC|nr:hypothetical protein O9G_005622 [Rozella allomycis CSF55]|eukprot:EPZ33963.1 hypothetical protein O9G_005622 [Rozella allomycis CSF55]
MKSILNNFNDIIQNSAKSLLSILEYNNETAYELKEESLKKVLEITNQNIQYLSLLASPVMKKKFLGIIYLLHEIWMDFYFDYEYCIHEDHHKKTDAVEQ